MAGWPDGWPDGRGSDYNATQPNWVGVGAELGKMPGTCMLLLRIQSLKCLQPVVFAKRRSWGRSEVSNCPLIVTNN